jgi:AcrR family transcriptional regulator
VKKSSPVLKASRRARPKSARAKEPIGPSAEASTGNRILIAAAQLFATRGFAHTSMPAIAKRSGITPGAIYRHFESKAQLLIEVVRYALEKLPTTVRLLEPAKVDARELPEFAASYTRPAASREENANKLLSKVNEQATQAISESIAEAQRSGALKASLKPDFTARFLLVTIMGLIHMDTLEPHLIGDPAWHDFVLERVSDMLGFRSPSDSKANSDHSLQPALGNELESE